MSNRTQKKAPIVRLPPKAPIFELLLARGAQVAMIFMGLVAFVFALQAGEYILAPVAMGIVIGLMLGPVASRLERRGLPPGLSAFVVFVLFMILVGIFAFVVWGPLSLWASRVPQIWTAVAGTARATQGAAQIISGRPRRAARHRRRRAALRSRCEDGSPVESVATLAPVSCRANPHFSRQPLFLRRDPPSDAHRDPEALLHAASALAHGACLPRRRGTGLAVSSVRSP